MKTHDDYIAAAPEPFRAELERLRGLIAKALPDAEQVIMYNMPGFRVGSKVVASYAAFAKQCGFYCAAEALSEYADELKAAGLKPSKTGVTFPPMRPIPETLVIDLAQASARAAPR
ncbi:iron chaperone [Devosia sediminis]|nr:DUF1801 domain-containing protein [Devosia sediminis]